MKKAVLLGIIIILISLFFGTGIYFKKPDFLLSSIVRMASLASIIDNDVKLKSENINLKQEIFLLKQNQSVDFSKEIPAKVFSLYPFNFKSRVFISFIPTVEVLVGEPVVVSKLLFLGKIIEVNGGKAEVMTIFDPSFSLSVRIGEKEVDGLLEGGTNPKITLISKNKEIKDGDIVSVSAKDFPYGLVIGNIKSFQEDSSGAFFEAIVETPYQLNDLKDVFIVAK